MNDLPKPLPHPGPWIKEGLCREVEPYERRQQIFFPDVIPKTTNRVKPGTPAYDKLQALVADRHEDVQAGKAVCLQCPVRRECGLYAVANRIEHGTWGGVSEWERRAKPGRPAKRLSEEVVRKAGQDYCPYCKGATTAPRGPRQMYCLDCHVTWQLPKGKKKDDNHQSAAASPLQPPAEDQHQPQEGCGDAA